MPFHQSFKSALENLQLSPRPPPYERVTPSPLDMAHHSQCTTFRMPKQPLRQVGNESVRGDSWAFTEGMGKIIYSRRARPEAGKVEGEQSQHPCIVSYIIACEIEVLGDSLPPTRHAGPILTQQCALMEQLAS